MDEIDLSEEFLLSEDLPNKENNKSWQWLLLELKKCIPRDNGSHWTIISDEHQGTLILCNLISYTNFVHSYFDFVHFDFIH